MLFSIGEIRKIIQDMNIKSQLNKYSNFEVGDLVASKYDKSKKYIIIEIFETEILYNESNVSAVVLGGDPFSFWLFYLKDKDVIKI